MIDSILIYYFYIKPIMKFEPKAPVKPVTAFRAFFNRDIKEYKIHLPLYYSITNYATDGYGWQRDSSCWFSTKHDEGSYLPLTLLVKAFGNTMQYKLTVINKQDITQNVTFMYCLVDQNIVQLKQKKIISK